MVSASTESCNFYLSALTILVLCPGVSAGKHGIKGVSLHQLVCKLDDIIIYEVNVNCVKPRWHTVLLDSVM